MQLLTSATEILPNHPTIILFALRLPSKMNEFEKASAIDHANIVYKKEVGLLDCPPESIPVTIPCSKICWKMGIREALCVQSVQRSD